MSSYWNSGIRYSQPTTSELKKRSAESIKREKGKGSALEPVRVTGRTIAKTGGDRPGAAIWSSTRTMPADWTGGNATSGQGQSWT